MAASLEEARTKWAGASPDDHSYGQMYATCAAAWFESKGLGKDAGPIWQIIGFSQQIQIEQDPGVAFVNAVNLIMFPDCEDIDTQQFIQWLRGNGLQQLTDSRLSERLNRFVETEQGYLLLGRLVEFIDTPIPYNQIRSKHDLGSFPECYLTFLSVLLASGLLSSDNNHAIVQLKEKAIVMINNRDFQQIVRLYATITDTKMFADQLLILV